MTVILKIIRKFDDEHHLCFTLQRVHLSMMGHASGASRVTSTCIYISYFVHVSLNMSCVSWLKQDSHRQGKLWNYPGIWQWNPRGNPVEILAFSLNVCFTTALPWAHLAHKHSFPDWGYILHAWWGYILHAWWGASCMLDEVHLACVMRVHLACLMFL